MLRVGVILILAAMLVMARADPVVSSMERTERSLEVCHLPKQTGACYAYFPRFYYDTKTHRCEEFVYGGCGGNENNFQTMEECQTRCNDVPSLHGSHQHKTAKSGSNPVDTETVCHLPKQTGRCRGHFPRFYYDTKASTCKEFIYGGCSGNENNFETIDECQTKCNDVSTLGNSQNDRSDKSGTNPDDMESVCHLPKQTGRCRGHFPRFYYDTKTATCKEFIYGGCAGNENNFETIDECQTKCNDVSTLDNSQNDRSDKTGTNPDDMESVCHLPKQPGSCYAYFPRFYYDTKTHRCEEFVYGGCGGNENNFQTMEECQTRCNDVPSLDGTHQHKTDKSGSNPKDTETVCHLPKKSGKCKGFFPRFYYNDKSLTCEEFVYGGCDGNGNNFVTMEECQAKCSVVESVCHLPKVSGICRANFLRFYYNSKTSNCEEFVYGGCEGNGNNFRTIEECQTSCNNVASRLRNADSGASINRSFLIFCFIVQGVRFVFQ